MRKLRMNKRGFTLAELCVVMALIAIATLLMTSFMAVFQTRTAQNTARHDFLDEVALVRDEMQKWVSNRDGGEDIRVSTNLLSANLNNADCVAFSSEQSNIIFRYSVGDVTDAIIPLKAISNVEFAYYKSEVPEGGGEPVPASNNQKILICTFTGKDAFGQEFSQTMMFSLMSDKTDFIDPPPANNAGES